MNAYDGCLFPSPYGDCGSYLEGFEVERIENLSGFRPLTGIVVLIDGEPVNDNDVKEVGFRPLTGIVVLIDAIWFPMNIDFRGRFRPLTGIVVLISDLQDSVVHGAYSFRPLTGIVVLIDTPRAEALLREDPRCFRPLTGIVVLIRTPYKWLHSAIENAFCGADFLFSSFFTFLRKMIFKNRPIADF